MTLITSIKAREILDSRGNPTLEVEVVAGRQPPSETRLTAGTFCAKASVPSGVSTGVYEARELRDGGKRYLGKGVLKAVKNINEIIAPALKGIEITNQKKIDALLLKLDGTVNKSNLGSNALLGVSLACARTAANSVGKELYLYLNNLVYPKKKIMLPVPFMNVIEGGKHAGSSLPFQEFMIVPQAQSFAEALRLGSETYHVLKGVLLQKYGKTAVNVGDEGGFVPPVSTAEEVLDLLKEAIKKAGHSGKINLAMDAAASEFYLKGQYVLGKEKKLSSEELLKYYLTLSKKYSLLSLEDPFHQEDFQNFSRLKKQSKIQIVGDDLTVTNPLRIKKAIREQSVNCLLLKVNQIGTLTEALEAAKLAYQAGWKVIVSHRGGETNDDFIADLAVALGCGMIKAGAPCRGERVAKYNRLLQIEEKIYRNTLISAIY